MIAGVMLVVVGIAILVLCLRRECPGSMVILGMATCATCAMVGLALILDGV